MFDLQKREKMLESINIEYGKRKISKNIRDYFYFVLNSLSETDIQNYDTTKELLQDIWKEINQHKDEEKFSGNGTIIKKEMLERYNYYQKIDGDFAKTIDGWIK